MELILLLVGAVIFIISTVGADNEVLMWTLGVNAVVSTSL